MKKALCQTKQDHYIISYPVAIEFAEAQFSVGWPPGEIPVEDDIQEFIVHATPADRHAVTTILKLFTKYELEIGEDYWLGRVMKNFPRPDIQRMAVAFGNAELNMHAPFYNELNKALNLDTEEFYDSYKENPDMDARIKFIGKALKSQDDLLSLATFSMIEGAVLYSAFAFLKHYRNGGKNLFKHMVSGINFSVRDENMHAEGGAWLFHTLLGELELSEKEKAKLATQINEVAVAIIGHEAGIIDAIFAGGEIEGTSASELKVFARSRLNLCMGKLGLEPLFEPEVNPIADWFYDNINAITFHDFFETTGSEYHRNWHSESFKWGQVA
jgi:ribonucleoside-diphosphate reductase beta chain